MDGRKMNKKGNPKPIREDVIGKTFGTLEVICGTDEFARHGRLYKCRCNVCGLELFENINYLTGGQKKTCGDKNCKKVLHGGTPDYSDYIYQGKEDCMGYASDLTCSILSEMFCRTRGKCKFYKAKEES